MLDTLTARKVGVMRLESIALDTINTAALRLVTFASQSLAQAFVRTAMNTLPDENGLLLAARMDGSAVQSYRQAVCRVAGIARTVAHEAGTSYVVNRGDRKGKTVTAAVTTYRPYNTAEYHEACEALSLALVQDESTVVTHTDEAGKVITVASYAVKRTAS
jgi:hypothetical protein